MSNPLNFFPNAQQEYAIRQDIYWAKTPDMGSINGGTTSWLDPRGNPITLSEPPQTCNVQVVNVSGSITDPDGNYYVNKIDAWAGGASGLVVPLLAYSSDVLEEGDVAVAQFRGLTSGGLLTEAIVISNKNQIFDNASGTPTYLSGPLESQPIRLFNDTGISLGSVTSGEPGIMLDLATISSGILTSGVITSAMLASGSVTTDAIASGAVTSGAIADGSVTPSKLASGMCLMPCPPTSGGPYYLFCSGGVAEWQALA